MRGKTDRFNKQGICQIGLETVLFPSSVRLPIPFRVLLSTSCLIGHEKRGTLGNSSWLPKTEQVMGVN